MTRASLHDVNVLVALFDAEHVHHEVAHDWFSDNRETGWSTCPLTENGFVRIVADPSRRGEVMPIPDVVAILRRFCASGHHEFWPDSVSLLDDELFDLTRVRGRKQITDVYLLGLAVTRRARLVTFDSGVRLDAVKGAMRAHLEVLAPT